MIGLPGSDACRPFAAESDEVDANLRPTDSRNAGHLLVDDGQWCGRRPLLQGLDSEFQVIHPGIVGAGNAGKEKRTNDKQRPQKHVGILTVAASKSSVHCPTWLSETVTRYLITGDEENRTFLLCSTCGNESPSVECAIDGCKRGARAVCQSGGKRPLGKTYSGPYGEHLRCHHRARRAAHAREEAREPEAVFATRPCIRRT